MFPYIETRVKGDEYGLPINPDDFALPVDRDEVDNAVSAKCMRHGWPSLFTHETGVEGYDGVRTAYLH